MMKKHLIVVALLCPVLSLGGGGCGGEPEKSEGQRVDLPFLGGKADVPSWLRHIPADWGCDDTILGVFSGYDSAHLYSFSGKVGYTYTFSFEASYPWYKGTAIAVYDAESGQRVALERVWDNIVSVEYKAEADVKYLVAVYSIYVYATGSYTLSAACELEGCQINAVGYDCQPKCRKTGCSGQLCADQDMFSTCEYLPWYSCYSLSECGRFGENNSCAWQETEDYLACMDQFGK